MRIIFAVLVLVFCTSSLGDSLSQSEQSIILETPTGKISGSLLLPAEQGRVPVVLIIAGSGPTDRDGNSKLLKGPNNNLKLLAQALVQAGIATVRYDKRGIAASAAAGPVESDLRFDDYVNDAAAWVRLLKQDSRFSSVTVVGHSEGSLIGMLATRGAHADAFVSIAGPAQKASDVLRKQLRPKLSADLEQENERILASLERGNTTSEVLAPLHSLYPLSLQPYLISWFRYVPTTELAKVDAPVLVIQGTNDIQVPVTEAESLKRAKPTATVVLVQGMNHVLKIVPLDMAQQEASYSDPARPLATDLTDTIIRFLKSHKI